MVLSSEKHRPGFPCLRATGSDGITARSFTIFALPAVSIPTMAGCVFIWGRGVAAFLLDIAAAMLPPSRAPAAKTVACIMTVDGMALQKQNKKIAREIK